ncbi:MAG: hypothetical protein KC445_05980, partial [Anaerolineales bacterium]|nr:hypothetical protein [Anaerolineales bacterium]
MNSNRWSDNGSPITVYQTSVALPRFRITIPHMLDVNKIRADFPILQEEAYPGVPLIYLDSAASSQKPLPVIEA